MNDILNRALRTFIQAFLGVFIPELCTFLTGNIPSDLHAVWLILVPVLCASLAAGISAAWNYIDSHLSK